MPDIVPGAGGPASSRIHGMRKPHYLAKMLEMAGPVLRTEGEVMKWARRENAYLGGRPLSN
ncbi:MULTISPECIES: hypothetical protein [Rhizobium]|uniref:Uncharacterized protein n=1 Tax=Rhizobium altiplani TaxID=1864509 RepID=A0A109K172_9HYPH|nr:MULTISPECIES: hypothetical protein [Rhizobium]KWV58840.1 hypothetical protein AS026_29660 [Rhizobium altiplani]